MSHRYLVLGAGMQGTAAAYDLARFAASAHITLADANIEKSKQASERVNRLVHRDCCFPIQLDAMRPESLTPAFENVDVVLSCVPYWMHPEIAVAAIAAKANMCDLGGNTEITWKTLELHHLAQAAGVTLVPDCGLAPGLVNSLGLFLIEKFQTCESVKLYCGVLPQHPKPPFNYKLTFNVEGLVTEYDYRAIVLRDGQITEIDTLSELERIHIDELGEMEAFTTSGGTSTAAYTFQENVQNYEYKTIRFPGHCERMRIFKDFGFWGEEPIDIKGNLVRPKDLFCKVFGERLGQIQDTDQCAIRAIGRGTRDGKHVTLQVDLYDRQCEATGFTSMERLTGFSLSIVAQQIAHGRVSKGGVRYEQAMTGAEFVNRLYARGIEHKFRESFD